MKESEGLRVEADKSIGFLGPEGTFTQEALATQRDLRGFNLIPYGSIDLILNAVQKDEIGFGFVPIENSIEGTVAATIDSLIFDYDVVIIREVIHDIHLQLLGLPGASKENLTEIWSFSHAFAQCRKFLAAELPKAELKESTSTADGALRVSCTDSPSIAAIAPRVAGEIYGLAELATDIEDHQGNQTRFFLVRKDRIPKPTGDDKTAVACFQLADAPGSLFSILAEFAARNINLTKLESRPSKLELGQYCFIIEFDGHVGSPVVADLFLSLKRKLAGIKFLGSFPRATTNRPATSNLLDSKKDAETLWIKEIQSRIDAD